MSTTTQIPLVIINFNQLTYLRNLVTWWRWYAPDAEIFVLDNASSYPPLLEYYEQEPGLDVRRFPENKAPENLRTFLDEVVHPRFSHYVVSDADVCPHPATPMDFLEVLRHAVDELGYHHAGLGLIIDDLPPWSIDRELTLRNEGAARDKPVKVRYDGREIVGHKAPIDTTFCLFKTANGGWYAPMKPKDWTNSLRVFEAFHLPWYLDAGQINAEMDNYFRTARHRDHGAVSAGKNNYRPAQYRTAEDEVPAPPPAVADDRGPLARAIASFRASRAVALVAAVLVKLRLREPA
jgi:hypothetical protein